MVSMVDYGPLLIKEQTMKRIHPGLMVPMVTMFLGFACSSGNNNGGLGGAGGSSSGGRGGGAGTGAGGAGTGGVAGTGGTGAGGSHADAGPDAPADGSSPDVPVAATFTQVFTQILNNTTMPTPATSPGCANCHDGMPVDGGSANAMISHSINYRDKAAAYIALVGTQIPAVGVDSLRCPGMDGGAAIKRVRPGNPDESVLVQKLRQGLGIGTACDGVAMPLNIPVPNDGGADAGGDAGFSLTTHAITTDELNLVISWVNAGALNN
jgi:hypothetical protein